MQSKEEIRKEKFEMIESWQQSSLTQKAWCIRESITYHSFHYWYKRYKQDQSGNQSNKPAFKKLQIAMPVATSSVEVHFPGGIRLLFHDGVSSDYIKSIIS